MGAEGCSVWILYMLVVKRKKRRQGQGQGWRGAIAKLTAMERQIPDSGRNPHENKSKAGPKEEATG